MPQWPRKFFLATTVAKPGGSTSYAGKLGPARQQLLASTSTTLQASSPLLFEFLMFSNNTGFQVSGGSFYSVAGDVNLQINAPPVAGHPEEPRTIPDGQSLDGGFSGDTRPSDRSERRFAPYGRRFEWYSAPIFEATTDTSSRPRLQDIVHIATPNFNHHIYEAPGTLALLFCGRVESDTRRAFASLRQHLRVSIFRYPYSG
ncbi:hypothetical protein FB45DRAFT_1080627 [Roridomyces roridus]|uniref:Uncharacterized protein n=1 Tax=Roridomyces roridus TaxID=1738132 RepID=A0AAD7FMU9_9AGAR|nr:hypothetical protein FB45DRAFT_1080627 [Roridomyces roridus]